MNHHRHTAIPRPVLSAFLGLIPIGIVLGVLYGLEILSLLALDLIFFGSLAVLIPWAVLQLDPRGCLRARAMQLSGRPWTKQPSRS